VIKIVPDQHVENDARVEELENYVMCEERGQILPVVKSHLFDIFFGRVGRKGLRLI
jgi:hypothetical protein